jgi:hypothetical protein
MISPRLNMIRPHANADDFQRAATERRINRGRAQPQRSRRVERNVTIRLSAPQDEHRLAKLAQLDSSRPPAQPVLLAEVDGQLAGAISLSDGTVVANPFRPTADVVDLLRVRAAQVGSISPIARSRGLREHWAGAPIAESGARENARGRRATHAALPPSAA